MKKFIVRSLMALGLVASAFTAQPTTAQADCYHYEYVCVGYKYVAYTAYDHCGRAYTAYKKVAVYQLVKVYH
jgi:hypothetical protein